LPTNRPPAEDRVDDWDDDPPPAAPTRPAAPAQARAPEAEAAEMAAEDAEEKEANLPWRQLVRTTPLWIWLIAVTTLGSICIMFFIIMILLATKL
jgi:hypothetical protein